MFNSALKLAGLFAIVTVLVCACAEPELQGEVTANKVEDIEVFVPEKIMEFDHIDTLYYSFIGLNSFATDDGGLILPVWGLATLVKTNKEATEVLALTKQGRGPGELLDVGVPTMGENEIYVYDQVQQKAVLFDRTDLSLVKEFLVGPYQEYRINRVYPSFEEESVLIWLNNSLHNMDRITENLLIKFNSKSGEYGKSIAVKGQPQAPLGEVGNGTATMGMRAPFSDNSFIVSIPERKTLLLYDTRTNLIAEINASFDTLQTIPVELPRQEVSSAEKDSIKAEVDALAFADWGTVEPYIPTIKAPADDMLYHNNEIWLKSNFRGNHQKWMVIDMEGRLIKEVKLPKGSRIMHISEEHLGVRINEVTFALYENPVGD